MASQGFNIQSVDVWIQQGRSPAERSALLAQAARAGVAELIATGQASDSYARFVDGVPGTAEESVKPDGVIVYEFQYLGDVVAATLQFLKGRSPRRSGRYQNSFYVGIDGRFVMARDLNPANIPETAEIVIGNTQPYSRKIDVQMEGSRQLKVSVPPNLFADAVAMVKSHYGNQVSAKRVYTMTFPGQYRLRREQQYRSGRRKGRAVGRLGTAVQSPAIIITSIRR